MIPAENVVYADESGMDNRDEYAYGWNKSGERFHALKSGRRQGRVNMIAAYCNHQLIAPFTVEGACNPHSALQLLRHILVTKTRQFDDTTGRNSLIAATQN